MEGTWFITKELGLLLPKKKPKYILGNPPSAIASAILTVPASKKELGDHVESNDMTAKRRTRP